MSKFRNFFYTKKGQRILRGVIVVCCIGIAFEVYNMIPKQSKDNVIGGQKISSSRSSDGKIDMNCYKIIPDSDDTASTQTIKTSSKPAMVLNIKAGKKMSNYARYMTIYKAKYRKSVE